MSTQVSSKSARRLLLVLAVIVLILPVASPAADNKDPNHLSGAVAITITLPANPLGLPTTIQVLGNFTEDGNFIFSDSLGKFGPPPGFTQSPGHGQWERTGKGRFILDSWHIVFDANGQFFGVSRGRAAIEFDPKTGTITGTNFLELIPNLGPPFPGLPGTIAGKMLPVNPPPPAP